MINIVAQTKPCQHQFTDGRGVLYHESMKTIFIITGVIMLLGSSCLQQDPSPQPVQQRTGSSTTAVADTFTPSPLTASELATGLLTAGQVNAVVPNILPSIVEFNGQLDTYLTDYDWYVGRFWRASDSADVVLVNSLIKYTSPTAAQTDVRALAANNELISAPELGDASVAYYDDPLLYYGGPSDPAVLTYRFSVGQFAAKVELVDVGNVTDEANVIQQRLLNQVLPLAQAQYDTLVQLVSAPTTDVPSNVAITQLPETIPGASYIGTTVVTDAEWRGLSQDDRVAIPGLVSAGLSRFSLTSRPSEVVEVVIFEFDTATAANQFRDELKDNGEVITVPDTLADTAVAITTDNMVELQAAEENFVIDISIFSPFEETNLAVAETELMTIAEKIVPAL